MTRARTWSLNRSLEWARRLGASPPKRITASWSSSRVEPPNTRLRRDLRALWRAPLGSLAISQAPITLPPRPKPRRPAHTLRDGAIPFRYVTGEQSTGPISRPPRDRATTTQGPLPSAGGQTHQIPALVRHRQRAGHGASRVMSLGTMRCPQPARQRHRRGPSSHRRSRSRRARRYRATARLQARLSRSEIRTQTMKTT